MIESLKVCLADDEPAMQYSLERMLRALGHDVKSSARSGQELVEAAKQHQPDLIIADIVMPGLDGIDAAKLIWREQRIPAILVSAHQQQELLDRAQTDPIFGYLVKPVDEDDLEVTIRVAIAQFERYTGLLGEAERLKKTIADRKITERAKGIIMKRSGVSDAEAERKLEALANDRGKSVAEMGAVILQAELVLAEEPVREPLASRPPRTAKPRKR